MSQVGLSGGRLARSDRLRQSYSRYRDTRRKLQVPASRQSRYGLDWTNFFVADVQTGFGSLVAFYLSGLGWSQQAVGFVLSWDGIAAIVGQISGGAFADAVTWKRGLAAAGIVAIGMGLLLLALAPAPFLAYAAQAMHGLGAGLTTAAVASITLGLVGRGTISYRVGRNYRFSAAGTALTAGAMGVLGRYAASRSIFIAAAALCIPALVALFSIRAHEIDYARARNAGTGQAATQFSRVLDLRKNRDLLVFTGTVILFQLASADMLPAIAGRLGRGETGSRIVLMSILITIPQLITAVLAPWIGYHSERIGRRPLLLTGYGVQVLRAVVLACSDSSWALVLSQLLDGISGATVGVLTLLVITDVTTGSGRFNLARGLVATLSGIAASISTSLGGLVLQHFGQSPGFLLMAATALGTTLLTWTLLPETKPSKYLD